MPSRLWGVNAESAHASSLAKVLVFSALAEFVTGMTLIIAPKFVVTNLLAPVTCALIIPIARVAGIALIALGLACWTGWDRVRGEAFRALFAYNLLVAVYLAFLGTARHLSGVLLRPAVALHALVTALLLFLWIAEKSRPSS